MWMALMMSMLSGIPGAEGPAGGDKDRDLKITARAAWPVRNEKATQLVIHSAEELALAHNIPAKDAREKRFQTAVISDVLLLLKVKAIDWDKQMLVVASAGQKPTGGYRVEITSLAVKDGTLTVRWKLHSPAKDAIVTQALTYPGEMVLVDRYVGNVKFDPPARQESKGKDK